MACFAIAACGSGHGTTSATTANTPSTTPTTAGQRNRYDPRVQATVLRTCTAAAGESPTAATRCKCYLTHLEARISEPKLAALERAIIDGKVTFPQWLRRLALSCARS